ncbi:MAG: hypothetical protein ACK5KP_06135 [Paludibacteraceae bacterium]
MTTKNKIALTLLLSLLVFGAGSYYLYSRFSNKEEVFDELYNLYGSLPEVPVIITPVNIVREGSRKIRNTGNEENSSDALFAGMISDSPFDEVTIGVGKRDRLQTTRGGNGLSDHKKTEYATNNGSIESGLLAYSTRSPRGTDTESGSSGSLQGFASTPFGVPRTNTNGVILVDPMPDTTTMNKIPVGESTWLLLLLAGLYAGYRRRK